MPTNKEFVLARALSRTLAALEHPEQLTSRERQDLIEQSQLALSSIYTLGQKPPLWEEAVVFGRGAGWSIRFQPSWARQDHVAGCVAFEYCVEGTQTPKKTGATMYFSLQPDPMETECQKDTLAIAAAVGRFVETILDAKGLKNWWPVQVEFREGWLINGPEIRGPSIIKLLDLENLPAL